MNIDGKLVRLGPVPVAGLQNVVPQVSEQLWQLNPFRQSHFSMHRLTRSLIFRYIPGDDPAVAQDLAPWRAWKALLEPTIAAAVRGYGPGRCCRILLASLPPGAAIEPHRDTGPTYEATHRIHVPVRTDPRVVMQIGGEPYHLEAGQAYEINNILVHAVTNASDIDRVHLIVDYLASSDRQPQPGPGSDVA